MNERVQSIVGSGIGCAIVGFVSVMGLALVALLALAFPITISIVTGTVVVLACLQWRRRRSGKGDRAPR